MKVLICALLLATVALVHATLSPEAKERIKRYHKECVGETGVDGTVAKKTLDGIFPEDDPKLKMYLVCYSKKAHFMDDNGDLNETEIKNEITKHMTPEQVNIIVTNCLNKKTTPEATAFEMWKCWRSRMPKPDLD